LARDQRRGAVRYYIWYGNPAQLTSAALGPGGGVDASVGRA
jgi:hypothetical protein